MRALITGITGFVGSHLAEYLLNETDWEIYGLYRYDDPLDNIPFHDEITLIEGDLTDYPSVENAIARSLPDYVFHLAAQSYVQASFAYPEKTYRTNVIGTENLLRAIKDCHYLDKKPLIHNCSSSEVYGRVPGSYGPIDENCPFLPASPYSISKCAQDLIGRFYFEAYGLKVITTRMFTHTGPRRGDVFFESSFAKQVAMCEVGLIDTIKVGNLESTRTIADVRDAVRAYHLLLTKNPIPGEVYNIGGNYTCKVKKVLEYLNWPRDGAGEYPVESDPTRMRPLDADFQIPNCDKFKKHTGWVPVYKFGQTMDDLLEYWRKRIKHHVVIQR